MSNSNTLTFDLNEACKLSKSDVRNYISLRLNIIHPEYKDRVTKRMIGRTLIYLEGYSARLKEEMTPPVNIKDVQTLLLSEGFKYIWSRIEK